MLSMWLTDRTEYDGSTVDVVIDSVDTLYSNLGSQSKTYKLLNDILTIHKNSSSQFDSCITLCIINFTEASSRLITHVLAPCPLIPLLTEVRLSPALCHLKSHPPVLLTHISSAYLIPPPPQSSPEKFWSVFGPLSERQHECEKLVYGSDGEGSGGSAIVVEVLIRSAGGTGRKRGVERELEGWMSSTSTPCNLQMLESLKPLWTKKVVLQEVSCPVPNYQVVAKIWKTRMHRIRLEICPST